MSLDPRSILVAGTRSAVVCTRQRGNPSLDGSLSRPPRPGKSTSELAILSWQPQPPARFQAGATGIGSAFSFVQCDRRGRTEAS